MVWLGLRLMRTIMWHFRQCGQWSAGSWLHSYIPTSRSRHCGQYYGPGTKPLTTSLGNKRFLLSLDTLNLTFVNIVNMHGSRNHWVSFPYYCVLMNSWHWSNTGWPSKVREDASHIWQPTADHWVVDTGHWSGYEQQMEPGPGQVVLAMLCITGEGTAIYYCLSSWELGDPRGASTVTFSSEDEVAVYVVLLPSSKLSLCLMSARPRPHCALSAPLPRPWPTPGTRRGP